MIEISLVFGLAIYGIVWFLTLFIVLPFGVVSQGEAGDIVPGSTESAPAQPRIVKKLVGTTVLSIILYAILYLVLTTGMLANIDLPFFPELKS
jgi:predicted secreted protein